MTKKQINENQKVINALTSAMYADAKASIDIMTNDEYEAVRKIVMRLVHVNYFAIKELN